MDSRILLAKTIAILYNAHLVKDVNKLNKVKDLVIKAINKIPNRDIGMGFGHDQNDPITILKNIVNILLQSEEITKLDFVQQVRILTESNESLYLAIMEGIDEDLDFDDLIKLIKTQEKSINRFINRSKIGEVLTQANTDWTFNRTSQSNEFEFIKNLQNKLSTIPIDDEDGKDGSNYSGIVEQVKLSDDHSVVKAITNIHVSVNDNMFFVTGFQGINRMLQGGIRPGEQWVSSGLQHGYKTGFSQTIFNGVVKYNKPFNLNPGKKPCAIVYAFEDNIQTRLSFIIKQLMHTATKEYIEIKEMKVEDMVMYIKTSLEINGFDVHFYKIDPFKWSFQHAFDHVAHLESQGYSVEFILNDYLEKIPTTGCGGSTIAGNDLQEMFVRFRQFYGERRIANWTPHQLSTDAKMLIRGAITEDKFVKALENKSYLKGSKQLDQIPDGLLYHHKFKYNGRYYFSVQRDRHRIDSILDDKYKCIFLPFPSGMPIPDDYLGEDSTLYKLPSYSGNADDEEFEFKDIE